LRDHLPADSASIARAAFLRSGAAGIASIDLFVVRTISFKPLYGLVILGRLRSRLVRSA